MKKITLILAILLFSLKIYAQQNVFPNNGNVGIGTTSPSVKLDVNGQLKVTNTSEFNGNIKMSNIPEVNDSLLLPNGNGYGNGNSNGNGNGNGNGNNNTLFLGNYKMLLLDDEGNVNTKIISDEWTPYRGCRGLNEEYFGNWVSGPNKLYSNCPSIDVGIYTDEPRVALDVRGTMYSNKIALGNVSPTGLGNTLLHLKSFDNFTLENKLAIFENGVNEIYYIRNNGEINHIGQYNLQGKQYINTELPNSDATTVFYIKNNDRKIFQVENNGLMRAREIKVDLLTDWPDFVFEKDYKLMPLKEVEKFYQTHKHLPAVPNAKTIEKEGLNLGEMDKILLQKIEELTLYIVELEKKIEKQDYKIQYFEKVQLNK